MSTVWVDNPERSHILMTEDAAERYSGLGWIIRHPPQLLKNKTMYNEHSQEPEYTPEAKVEEELSGSELSAEMLHEVEAENVRAAQINENNR